MTIRWPLKRPFGIIMLQLALVAIAPNVGARQLARPAKNVLPGACIG